MYIPASEIETFHKNNKNHKLNVSGQDERELQAQLKKTLAGEEGKKEDEEPKFKAFTGKGVSLATASSSEDKKKIDIHSDLYKTLAAEYGDDPEMIEGIIMSMQSSEVEQIFVPDEPEAGEDTIEIQLRMPDGSKL